MSTWSIMLGLVAESAHVAFSVRAALEQQADMACGSTIIGISSCVVGVARCVGSGATSSGFWAGYCCNVDQYI
jgi:hypothetical protein